MSPRQRPNPRSLSRAPLPPVPDYVDPGRQLTFGDVGAVQQLAPALPGAIHRALLQTSGSDHCREVWCDDPPAFGGRCERHADEAARDLHRDLGRLDRTSHVRRRRIMP